MTHPRTQGSSLRVNSDEVPEHVLYCSGTPCSVQQMTRENELWRIHLPSYKMEFSPTRRMGRPCSLRSMLQIGTTGWKPLPPSPSTVHPVPSLRAKNRPATSAVGSIGEPIASGMASCTVPTWGSQRM